MNFTSTTTATATAIASKNPKKALIQEPKKMAMPHKYYHRHLILLVVLLSQQIQLVSGERKVMAKHTKPQYVRSQLPYKLFVDSIENEGCKRKLPKAFNWASLNTDSIELKLYFGDDSEYDEYNEYDEYDDDDDDDFHNTAGGGDLTQHQGGTKASYITKSMNQNLPTYCGSGWAHAAVSVLADRIKMIRMIYMADDDEEEDDDDYIHGNLPDVSLSVQFLLNCGGEIAGSCHGGSATGAFQFIKEAGYIPFETCQPYMACSSDSDEEFCKHIDTTCTPMNICKTCTREGVEGGNASVCNQISQFPKARIDEYGSYRLQDVSSIEEQVFLIKSEIAIRGPVTTGIAGHYLKNYTKGIIYDDESLRDLETTHEVSIIGWGVDEEREDVEYWIIRNSWGEYWGEMSFFRLELGTNMFGVESQVSWATIKDFTIVNKDPCFVDGRNCNMAAMNFIPGVSIGHS